MDKEKITYATLNEMGVFMLISDRGYNVYIDIPGRRDEKELLLHNQVDTNQYPGKFTCEFFGNDIVISEEELLNFRVTGLRVDPLGDDVVAFFVEPTSEWFKKNNDKLAPRNQTERDLYSIF